MAKETAFPITGWKLIFYVLGWIYGALNGVFWIIMIILHLNKNKGERFFNPKFHERVYMWGLIVTVIFIALILLVVLFGGE